MQNYDTRTYRGGIRNRINRITMSNGASIARCADSHDGQTNTKRTVIERTWNKVDPRTQQDGVKDVEV